MRKFLFTIAFITLGISASAQALPSLLVGSDASGLATGSTTTAKDANAWALENNVASMALYDGTLSAGVSYGMWQPNYANDKVIGGGVFYKFLDKMAVGISAKMFNQPSYQLASDGMGSKSSGTYTPKENSFALGLSYALTSNISVGLSGRYIKSCLAKDAEPSTFGVDIAAMYRKDALSAGLSVNNIGGKVNYGGNDYSQPSLVKAGAAYSFGNVDASQLTTSVEADYLFAGGLMAGLGLEYSFKDMLFARGGYHYGDSAKAVPSFASLGLGAKFAGFSLDFAYLLASETLGNSLLFGVEFQF